MRAVCLARPNQYAGVFLPPLDHFLIACGSMTAPQTADMQGFENIGLSLRVRTGKDGHTRIRLNQDLLIISEMAQAERRNDHRILGVEYAHRQNQIQVSVALGRADDARADIGIKAHDDLIVAQCLENIRDIAHVEGNRQILALGHDVHLFFHIAGFGIGRDLQRFAVNLEADQIGLALARNQAGAVDGAAQLCALYGDAGLPILPAESGDSG